MDIDSAIDTGSAMWSTPDDDQVLLDEDCSPSKTCRNMVGVSFDGFADEGTDVAGAWRATLQREGKLTAGSGSLADLVFGPSDS